MTAKLPPLPIPDRGAASCSGIGHSNEQMKSYALQAVREALERAAQKCEQQDYAEDCANAIRALAKEYE